MSFRKLGLIAVIAVTLCGGDVFAKGRSSSGSTGTGSKSSSTSVKGYMTKSGSHVSGYRKTTPDSTQKNNYSAKGNYNPHTGKVGTKIPTR